MFPRKPWLDMVCSCCFESHSDITFSAFLLLPPDPLLAAPTTSTLLTQIFGTCTCLVLCKSLLSEIINNSQEWVEVLLWWGFLLKTLWKKGLNAEMISLCAWICSSSQARVPSKKSLSLRSSLIYEQKFDAKSFHRRQNISDPISYWLNQHLSTDHKYLSPPPSLRSQQALYHHCQSLQHLLLHW